MKRNLWLLLLVSVLVILSACNQKVDEQNNATEEAPQPIAVELTVTEKADVDSPVEMTALVTQGEEKIEDADKVVYEVWEEGKKDESIMIDATNEENGLYTAETSFGHDGLFHIQVHVDARGMHTMPKKEVVVGDGGHYEEAHDEGDEHGHTEGFSMHFDLPESISITESTDLVVHIEIDSTPLEKARVRYEIWNEADADKRDWIEADEPKAGEYIGKHTFAAAGTYHIQIHVEDAHDLHEHEEFTVIVN
ncbi:FixH family protein [Sporosarcina sp. HYO08]|uniref:FixH family protein n=1 Tax=Sporosarcina sp. HYO08 TaxID=1759557 RepID=UPI000798E5EC|nr:FixH family protein [Sporosarcina sp. HYO08]KXH87099.1 hypothetical protein AU377_00540 [Sporosarcina sp. HYO08]